MADEFGDFEQVRDENAVTPVSQEGMEGQVRVRLPRKGEFIGLIVQRYGGNRMEVKTTDGKIRNCRVPGRFKRSLWLRPGDIILIVPWVDDDEKGDVVFKYTGSQISQLRKKGLINNLNKEF